MLVEPRAAPGGIAKVVAECSTIAGPWIELPARTDSSWKISVSTNVSRLARPQWTGLASLTGGLPCSSGSAGSAGFSTSTVPWTIAWVTR